MASTTGNNPIPPAKAVPKPTVKPPPLPPAPPAMPGGGAAGGPTPMQPGPGAPTPKGAAGPARPSAIKAQPVPKLPQSQFGQNQEIPQINAQPFTTPDTHVTPEYVLEQMDRVLLKLAEVQEDPQWSVQHIALAEQWRSAAEMLLNHIIAGHQAQGEVELKQQQLVQNHELHQQTLAHNDQKHVQGMRHTEDQHKMGMRQGEDMHKMGLQQKKQSFATQQQMDRQKMGTQQTIDRQRVVKQKMAAKKPTS